MIVAIITLSVLLVVALLPLPFLIYKKKEKPKQPTSKNLLAKYKDNTIRVFSEEGAEAIFNDAVLRADVKMFLDALEPEEDVKPMSIMDAIRDTMEEVVNGSNTKV